MQKKKTRKNHVATISPDLKESQFCAMPGIEFKELAAPFVVEQVHSTGLATWLKVQHGSHWSPVKSLSKRWDMVGCSTPFVSGSFRTTEPIAMSLERWELDWGGCFFQWPSFSGDCSECN